MSESPRNPPSSNQKMQIFILAGQSNMAGRGGVSSRHWDGVVPPECHPNPSILRFSAASLWEEARDPLHADIDVGKVNGVGPGMPFANAVLAAAGIQSEAVGLVPCAIGGSAIAEWARGKPHYREMVRRATAAASGCGEGARAVLWFQGESDTSSEHLAHAYKHNMEQLIRNVRSDLQAPLLPFIQVALASGNKKHIEDVRKAQMGIQLPNVICVDAKGLPLNDDDLHLSTEAQVMLGNMLAEAYLCHFSGTTTEL